MTIAHRIKEARRSVGLTQKELALRVGISQPTLSDLENGKAMGSSAIASIAATLGVSALWLAEGRGPKRDSSSAAQAAAPALSGFRSVPVISWVQAGAWSSVVEPKTLAQAEELMPAPADAGKHCFGLIVKGLSMFNPDGDPSFSEGDRILVDPDKQARHRSLVIAQREGDSEATFKQLVVEGSKHYLKALNPDWPDRIISVNGDARVCGVVIGKFVRY